LNGDKIFCISDILPDGRFHIYIAAFILAIEKPAFLVGFFVGKKIRMLEFTVIEAIFLVA
jgi:hypothetical protein